MRMGGQNVDLKGAGLQVIRRMGLEEQVRSVRPGELVWSSLGRAGRLASCPASDPSDMSVIAEVEILRRDLAELIILARPILC